MPKKISKAKSIKRTKRMADIVVCLCIIGGCFYIVKGAADRAVPVEQSKNIQAQDVTETEPPDATEAVDPDKIIFSSVAVPTKDKFYGDLILVNNHHQYYSTGKEDLVSIIEMNEEKNRDFYTAVDRTYTILRPVYEPMSKMIEDFYNLYFNDTLIIYGSYRSTEFQKELYENDLQQSGDDKSNLVAKPGFSEHESGYAFDFSESENYDYDGTGDFSWINENCYKYGFIVRYTKEKEKLTEIRDEPWHFRYVGIPHAYYMTKNNLCLEEYIDLLGKTYRYENEHLQFKDDNGNNYEVYFYPSDDGSETTNVPVPLSLKYDISGNNIDGFIVTVYKDIPADAQQETTTEPATEAETESDTEEETEEESSEDTEEQP